jgi:gamma-glutamyltranspeptidase/glutathione hydrolase
VLNTLQVESRLPPLEIERLRALGHVVQVGEPWSEGRLCAASRSTDTLGRRILRAGANPRGMQGYAVGR